MAKLCFVSFEQPGHMDFGGLGFIKLAKELQKKGHYIEWVFSVSEYKNYSRQVYKILEDAGISYTKGRNFYLTIDHHKHDILQSVAEFTELIRAKNHDCLIIDRLCVGAALSAKWASIPWVTVGTDGREWSFTKPDKNKIKKLIPLPSDTDLIPTNQQEEGSNSAGYSTKSYWATSPYLNLTFFPKSYYQNEDHIVFPPQTHFLGSGIPIQSAAKAKGEVVLITFGNTLNEDIKNTLLRYALKELDSKSIPVLVLTGNEESTTNLRKRFKKYLNLSIKTWLPYDVAYKNTLFVVGHGGTSFIWNGMREAVPLLAIPSIGDQVFGGEQIERLNIGRSVRISPSLEVKNKFIKKIIEVVSLKNTLNKGEFLSALNQMLDDDSIESSCQKVAQEMGSGGGVNAGVLLIEKLLKIKAPVTECVPEVKCCSVASK